MFGGASTTAPATTNLFGAPTTGGNLFGNNSGTSLFG